MDRQTADPTLSQYVVAMLKMTTNRSYLILRILTCINYHINEIHTFGESIAQIDMMERYDAAFALSAIQRLAPFESLFTTHLILIKLGKIINNDRNGQCDYQYAANATNGANNFPKRCRGTNVTVLHDLKLKAISVCFMYKLSSDEWLQIRFRTRYFFNKKTKKILKICHFTWNELFFSSSVQDLILIDSRFKS